MNRRHHRSETGAPHPEERPVVPADGRLSGAALVIVLAFLVIMTGLVVAFLSSITDETTGTAASSAAMTTRGLADAAIQLDIAQIRDATAGFARDTNGALLSNQPTGWASQPGAIRVFPQGFTGSNAILYKLYSATNLVASNAVPSNDLPPTGWWTKGALYTDLNSPVSSSVTGSNVYPIMDPSMTNMVTGTTNPVVDGFSIDRTVPCYYASNPAAMPVTWLYILRDGTVIAPDSGSTTTATFNNAAAGPTLSNPIVGRIAFWTDDETCKLNINTASEGVPWEIPTFQSLEDQAYQEYFPLGNEFNRFPGHPFSVSLSPVLWSYFGFSHPATLVWATPSTNTFMIAGDVLPSLPSVIANPSSSATNFAASLFGNPGTVAGILPRVAPATNGSIFGSFRTITTNRLTNYSAPLKSDRLYSSVDELAFASTNPSSGRNYGTTKLSPTNIASLRFFLTAESRAPEVNILNLPRICLWPLNDTNGANLNPTNPNWVTAAGTARWSFLDKSIAKCATLGTKAYYFTRFDPTDQTNDFYKNSRNVALHGYLANLLQTPMPGYGGASGTNSFVSRWGVNACYQTATLCYDYIRSCINLVDSYGSNTTSADATIPADRYAYSYTTPPTNVVASSTSADSIIPGTGQVAPILIVTNGVTTRGMGRFPTLKSATLVFCAVAADQPPLMTQNSNSRVPASAGMVNPLHPFINSMPSSTSSINQSSFWESAVQTITTNIDSNGFTVYQTNLASTPTGNQYPSFYPVLKGSTYTNFISTNGGLISFTAGTNSWAATNQYTNYVASNVIVSYRTNGILTNLFTNSWQTGTVATFANAKGITISHPGLVYGGDRNTNTGAFDIYNIYFGHQGNSAAATLGMRTADTFTYPVTTGVAFNAVTHSNVPFTNSASLTIYTPNTTSTNYPSLYQTVMQPMLVLDHAFVTPGFAPYMANFKVLVRGLDTLKADGAALFGPNSYGQTITNNKAGGQIASTTYGPDLGLSVAICQANAANNLMNGTITNDFPFLGNFVKAKDSSWNGTSGNAGRTFQLGGGTITVYYLKPSASLANYATTAPSANDTNLLQTISLVFPGSAVPTPKLPPFNGFVLYGGVANACIPGSNFPTIDASSVNFMSPSSLFPGNIYVGANCNYPGNVLMRETYGGSNSLTTANTFRSVEVTYGDWRLPSMMQTVAPFTAANIPTPGSTTGSPYTINSSSTLYTPHMLYFASNGETAMSLPSGATNFYWRNAHTFRGQFYNAYGDQGHPFLSQGTFIQGFNNFSPNGSDPGLVYKGGGASNAPSPNTKLQKLYQHINGGSWGDYPDALSTVDMGGALTNSIGSQYLFPNVWADGGDFDNGCAPLTMDGPYIGKVDDGTAGWWDFSSTGWGIGNPYSYWDPQWGSMGRSRFCPNLQVPSPGVLGSLPAGFDPANPSITNAWKTLVFCANPYSSNRVASMGTPPDYMIMDLFDMPVVQPYPISDPFSTAGRVNLNYQIAPFSHIKRDAALRGVLKAVQITAVPDSDPTYKFMDQGRAINNRPPPFSPTNNFYYHYPIHLNETLKQFDAKFSTNGFFRSGAEICTMWLYPATAPGALTGATNAAMALVSDSPGSSTNISNWWYANPGTTRKGFTGANTRRRPYTAIYGNVTTKSNTYQIHYRVQTLKQTTAAHGSGNLSTWIDPSQGGVTDKVVAEQRGSAVIERYINPSDSTLPDFTTNVSSSGVVSGPSMDSYYRFRILNAKQFTP
jgi:uncharacterized protein (TIGR02600 family)